MLSALITGFLGAFIFWFVFIAIGCVLAEIKTAIRKQRP